MKNILYLALAILLFGCQDESEITSRTELNNLYTIRDNPNDSIQHRVYEIYQKYGVPVYFNDTIGKTFLKVDGRGDSVFITEKLDLFWEFSSTTGTAYKYYYMKDPKVQSVMLDMVEEYLSMASESIYPFNIFLVDSVYTRTGDNYEWWGEMEKILSGGKYKFIRPIHLEFGLRTLFAAGYLEKEEHTTIALKMMKEQIKIKITNYQKYLDAFFQYSKKEWYSALWKNIFPGIKDQSFNCYTYLKDPVKAPYARTVLGKFGFVGGSVQNKAGGTFSPEDSVRDLDLYLDELLKQSREEFVALWGEYPLVMKKYDILYDIIVNKMKVEL